MAKLRTSIMVMDDDNNPLAGEECEDALKKSLLFLEQQDSEQKCYFIQVQPNRNIATMKP